MTEQDLYAVLAVQAACYPPAMQEPAAVVLAVISFARTLGMRVIAEGVETVGQAAFLEHHGCDEIQGYLVARPLPSAQLLERFRQPVQMPWRLKPG